MRNTDSCYEITKNLLELPIEKSFELDNFKQLNNYKSDNF